MIDKCAGIDLSLTSPAICIFLGGEDYSYDSCKFSYLTDNSKRIICTEYISGKLFPSYSSSIERYKNITSWVIDTLQYYGIVNAFIEDYSFGSTGRVFNIAENTGILKYHLWTNKINFSTIPPTVIKKIATGKGNANKEAMQASFINDTGIDIKSQLGLSEKQWNPSSDIIDSYYVCKVGALDYVKTVD